MQRTLITTADGSHSLYVEGLDEHYHSKHGAIQESRHVFIKTGLHHLHSYGRKEIRILEIGLGTGLNALLTWIEAEKLDITIHYTGLEAFPLEADIIAQLNYTDQIEQIPGQARDDVKKKYKLLHECEWERPVFLAEHFSLHKIKNNLQEVKFENTFDLIYFDAFGPR